MDEIYKINKKFKKLLEENNIHIEKVYELYSLGFIRKTLNDNNVYSLNDELNMISKGQFINFLENLGNYTHYNYNDPKNKKIDFLKRNNDFLFYENYNANLYIEDSHPMAGNYVDDVNMNTLISLGCSQTNFIYLKKKELLRDFYEMDSTIFKLEEKYS